MTTNSLQQSASDKSASQDKTSQIDVLISGGGPVGLMLALGLAQQDRQVVLVEKNQPSLNDVSDLGNPKAKPSGAFDGRVLALTYGSKCHLEDLGIWPTLAPFTTPLEHVHVSQKGYLGLTYLHAKEMNVPALGYSVLGADLGKVLWQAVLNTPAIKVLTGASLVNFSDGEGVKTVEVLKTNVADDTETETLFFDARLVVGADGTDSKVRTLLDLPIEFKDYEAFGVICKIETEQHPNGWSFERFTTEGPTALLPMEGHFHKAVWVVPKADIDRVKALDDATFMAEFANKMGERLGRFVSVSQRMSYPLTETYAPTMTKGRAILMGNASHTQHPVAAQGLNLGIRDIADFLSAMQSQSDIGSPTELANYAELRKVDHEKIMGLTDGLIQLFQNDSGVIGHMRGLGLVAMNMMPSVRKRFAKMTMGMKR